MNAYQRYNHFASGYGAGRDAAGRTVYTGQGYVSPSEQGKMDSHMNQLTADAVAFGQGMATARQNAFRKRAMRMQDEDRAFQRNMMMQNANRNYDIANKKIGLLRGLLGNS